MTAARAAVFHGPGIPLELRDIPLPQLAPREVLVEVVACTLCGSDVHSWHGRRPVPVPTILGHEILGRIAEFGPAAPRSDASGRPLALGDRVTWAVVASCGECFYCRRLLPQKCERQWKYGHEPIRPGRELTGGLASHCVLAPGTAIFAVSPKLSDAAVCPANCAGATVAAALAAAGPLAGANVLVMGCGMLGVTAAAWATALGAEVLACDIDPLRLTLATSFGATHTSTPADIADLARKHTGGHGVDIALELTGAPEAAEALIPLTRMGGSVILVGSVFPSRPLSLSPEQLVRRCLTLKGIHNYAPDDLRAALDFLESQPGLPFETLVADWTTLSDLDRALSEPLPQGKLRIGVRAR